MAKVAVQLPDESIMEVPVGATMLEVANGIGRRLGRDAVCGEVNGELVDLSYRLAESDEPVKVKIYTFSDPKGREVYRHSAAHVLADAVSRLFPGAKLGIGPAIDEGFYYDFDVGRPFTPEDLDRIEQEMKNIVEHELQFYRTELTLEEAKKEFSHHPYKLELIDELPDDEAITAYRHGEFIDLCAGPHVMATNRLGELKLLHAAGAYWRGDERRPMLQRIYGTIFPRKKELNQYLEHLKEAEKRDHRKLGKQLDLFSINQQIGSGLPLWHPNGALIRTLIEEFWKKQHLAHGYQLVYSPHIGRGDLWEQSGHLGFYRDDMYAPMEIDDQEYYLKPMNCPFHIMIYKHDQKSYRNLPIRYAELGTVYRYERSGVLHGLLRVRGFTQDDAHIICTPEQIEDEIKGVLDFTLHIWRSLGFSDFQFFISTRPDKSVGSDEMWNQATDSLENAIKDKGFAYNIDPGAGVFYGPKIDLCIKDALGRVWQCTTIQFDFNLPERFDMTYVGKDGDEHRPYMVHRALLGSLERAFAILIEHYKGAFPLWLSPVQVSVLPITENHVQYAEQIVTKARARGLRVELDDTSDTVAYRIRRAQMHKVPYMLVVGDKEQAEDTVSVRDRKHGDQGSMEIDEFLNRVTIEAAVPGEK